MFCPKCGNQLPDGSMLCTKCGNQFATRSQPTQASSTGASNVAVTSLLAGMSIDGRLPLGQLILSIVAAVTLFLPWEAVTAVTRGEGYAGVFQTVTIVAYNLIHSDNVAVPAIIMLACFVIGLLLMIIGSARALATKKQNAGAKASLVGAVIVVIFCLVVLSSGNTSQGGTLFSYAFSTSMTLTPWICLIVSAAVGVISFLRK